LAAVAVTPTCTSLDNDKTKAVTVPQLKSVSDSKSVHTEVYATLNPSQFRAKYQRNNKRGGLKNLRCFPACGATHRERGFCGRAVEVFLTPNSIVKPGWHKNFRCFAEFVTLNQTRFHVDEKVPVSIMESLERTADNPVRPLIQSDYSCECSEISPFTVKYEFNRRRKGWHYGWTANKHSCNTEHCLQIYIMSYQHGPDKRIYVVKNIIRSPSFVLFCRRRRRFLMEPSAPVAPPRKRVFNSEEDLIPDKMKKVLRKKNGNVNSIAPSNGIQQQVLKKIKTEVDMQETVDMAASLISFANSCHQLNTLQQLASKETMAVV